MIVLINAGGSGTRLWPLSTTELPKQFLNLVGNKSLLQQTYDRALLIAPKVKIYISTSESCSNIVKEQFPGLSDDQIILEPARRDTMTCILNATQYISSRHSAEEPIISLSSDHYIEDGESFVANLKRAAELSIKHSKIVLLGMIPDKPGPKFGHIHKGSEVTGESNVFQVLGFKEKPRYELAKEYQECGEYLWNSSYFVGAYKTFRDQTEKYSDPKWLKKIEELESTKTPEQRREVYLSFEREAIEFALMEKSPDLLVTHQDFEWADLGSFDDVYAVNQKDDDQNVINSTNRIISLESSHNYLQSIGHDKPIAIVGLKDIIVIDTPDGLLIAHMDQAQLVKKISEELEK